MNQKQDAARFRFIEENKIKCGIRENGYWEAEGETWVSRETLAECIDVLMRNARVTAPRDMPIIEGSIQKQS